VQATLPARLVLEVLDRVRHINGRPIDARLLQCVAEELARGADERVSSEVLFVAGLLAHEHHRGRRRAFAEHCLGSVTPKWAAPARCRLYAQVRQIPELASGAWQANLLDSWKLHGDVRSCERSPTSIIELFEPMLAMTIVSRQVLTWGP
jgi:hypothetical protein